METHDDAAQRNDHHLLSTIRGRLLLPMNEYVSYMLTALCTKYKVVVLNIFNI